MNYFNAVRLSLEIEEIAIAYQKCSDYMVESLSLNHFTCETSFGFEVGMG